MWDIYSSYLCHLGSDFVTPPTRMHKAEHSREWGVTVSLPPQEYRLKAYRWMLG